MKEPNRDELIAALDAYVTEALHLRAAGDLPPVAAAPADILTFLGQVRSRLDRIEELLARTLRLRARAHRVATFAQAEVDDAFDQAISEHRTAVVRPGTEFSSARERTAEANLATLDLRHTARRTHDLAHHCDEATDVIRLVHRGLDGLRSDVSTLLRAVAFESTLER